MGDPARDDGAQVLAEVLAELRELRAAVARLEARPAPARRRDMKPANDPPEVRSPVDADVEVTDLDRARARALARKLGLHVRDRR